MNFGSLVSYLKKHPLLVVTFSALSCAFIGFWLEYTLLANFGLNIGTFASIDYFLLAGVSSPKVLFIFSGLVVTNYLKIKLLTDHFPDAKEAHANWRIVIFLALIGVAGSFIYNNSEDKFKEITESPKQFVDVTLRTNNAPLSPISKDFTLITATDAFMLFYQHSTSAVIATPIENISAVSVFVAGSVGDVPE
ncbi:hypothetical protein UB37_13490 [Photobacterium iliopiscarium]|uniref:Uncharacterized protein n=1 Tax=Photobacterium iliopiscarium TaxID=56192 RepID=A0ABX5GMJ2_9GAMM|nr:hypothetical protein [Photobacterium iliopiscarium]KJG20733.1 hypothetical protein UB37_13490 [Photobacterium iliopiscarium]PSW92303.1 hypothetical protein C9J52_18945 [Photobacterium iliopiscarium]